MHYVTESKVQWKLFWLATQLYLQNDWLGGNVACAHYVLVSKIQRKPFWLAMTGMVVMGAVRITSLNPKFNGSHFDLPPSSIHRMTGDVANSRIL